LKSDLSDWDGWEPAWRRTCSRPAMMSPFTTAPLFGAPIYRTYGELIAGGKYKPAGFAAPLGFKDLCLAPAAAESLQVPMPLASLLRDRLLALLAQGSEALDWSALGGLAARDAGQEGSF
jgi:3-hydroxyisobutyrate dehydrogenase-like beta-hydroxyacid dehydrogenase